MIMENKVLASRGSLHTRINIYTTTVIIQPNIETAQLDHFCRAETFCDVDKKTPGEPTVTGTFHPGSFPP